MQLNENFELLPFYSKCLERANHILAKILKLIWKICEIMAKDLVCGMEVNEKRAAKTTYKGKIYYFCSPTCQWAFESNPKQFIKGKR